MKTLKSRILSAIFMLPFINNCVLSMNNSKSSKELTQEEKKVIDPDFDPLEKHRMDVKTYELKSSGPAPQRSVLQNIIRIAPKKNKIKSLSHDKNNRKNLPSKDLTLSNESGTIKKNKIKSLSHDQNDRKNLPPLILKYNIGKQKKIGGLIHNKSDGKNLYPKNLTYVDDIDSDDDLNGWCQESRIVTKNIMHDSNGPLVLPSSYDDWQMDNTPSFEEFMALMEQIKEEIIRVTYQNFRSAIDDDYKFLKQIEEMKKTPEYLKPDGECPKGKNCFKKNIDKWYARYLGYKEENGYIRDCVTFQAGLNLNLDGLHGLPKTDYLKKYNLLRAARIARLGKEDKCVWKSYSNSAKWLAQTGIGVCRLWSSWVRQVMDYHGAYFGILRCYMDWTVKDPSFKGNDHFRVLLKFRGGKVPHIVVFDPYAYSMTLRRILNTYYKEHKKKPEYDLTKFKESLNKYRNELWVYDYVVPYMQRNFENNTKGFYHGYDYVVTDESKWLDDRYIDTIDNYDPKKDVIAPSLQTMVNRLSSKCFFGK